MPRILLTIAVAMVIAAPAQAMNVMDWQCGQNSGRDHRQQVHQPGVLRRHLSGQARGSRRNRRVARQVHLALDQSQRQAAGHPRRRKLQRGGTTTMKLLPISLAALGILAGR